jgi:hypothetical protein
LIFTSKDGIFCFNFETNDISSIYDFKVKLKSQPLFFKANDEQSIFIVASVDDGIYVNLNQKKEVDIDFTYNIGVIKEI